MCGVFPSSLLSHSFQQIYQQSDSESSESEQDKSVSRSIQRLAKFERSRKLVHITVTDRSPSVSDEEGESSSSTGQRLNNNNFTEGSRVSRKRLSAPASATALPPTNKRRRADSPERQPVNSSNSRRSSLLSNDHSAQTLCSRILDAVSKHKNSWPFQDPVDVEEVLHLFSM